MLLDGALATTLQSSGLPPFTPVNAWLESHPDRIARVHQDFAAAGAAVVLAGTFRLQPQLDPRWRERGRIALDLAARSGRPVWLSVGPAGAPGRRWDGSRTPFREVAEAFAEHVAGVVLETFVAEEELLVAVDTLASSGLLRGPLVACMSPAPTGLLWSKRPPELMLPSLREAGADLVGFNCGPGCVAAARRCLEAGLPVDWLKPNHDDEPVPDQLLLAVPHVGGCCGTGPQELAQLARRRRALGLP